MLRGARDELEQRVRERTHDLQQSNDKLVAATKERALAESALRETQSELGRVARIMTVTELTASIAHEVNQPLAAVMANSEAALNWLRRSPPALSPARESIAAAVIAGQRASDVISRVRSLLTNGSPTLTTIDINELIGGVVALVQTTMAKRNVTIICQLAPNPPSTVGDRVQLQQLVLNLLNNAADAMASVTDRERELVLRTGNLHGDKITITVEDNGSGLSDVDTNKLFQPFYTTKQHGMGMGLSICRTIATSHNGTIQAVARKPHGAAFEVILPRRGPHDRT
jgi:C4-dicarboxylate-specific signal transduction histidine kinase